MDQPRGGHSRQQAARVDQTHHPHAQAGQSGVLAVRRSSDLLLRGPALPAESRGRGVRPARGRLPKLEEVTTRPAPRPRPRSFERAPANQLWQTDLFTFVLKRQNRRVYLVAFMDDHSQRFLVGYGLHASQSSGSGAGGAAGGPGQLRSARGGPDRQRQPVRPAPGGARARCPGAGEARRHSPGGGGTAQAAPDPWSKIERFLGDAAGGGVSRPGRLHGLRRRARRIGPVHRPLQLPKGRIRASTAWCRPTPLAPGRPRTCCGP